MGKFFLIVCQEPYVLDLFVYSRVPEDCKFFHFELAIETNATVGEDMVHATSFCC
jgi:hypothetical protein